MFTCLIFLAQTLEFYDNNVFVQRKVISLDIFQNANKLVRLIATTLYAHKNVKLSNFKVIN
jgi:hypothetical protein